MLQNEIDNLRDLGKNLNEEISFLKRRNEELEYENKGLHIEVRRHKLDLPILSCSPALCFHSLRSPPPLRFVFCLTNRRRTELEASKSQYVDLHEKICFALEPIYSQCCPDGHHIPAVVPAPAPSDVFFLLQLRLRGN